MRISQTADSAQGAKYLPRAKRLAANIRAHAGVKREIIDGFIVEGRKAGNNRKASVIDLPGEIHGFCDIPYSNHERLWPGRSLFSAPNRRVMLSSEIGEAAIPELDVVSDGLSLFPRPVVALGAVTATRAIGGSMPSQTSEGIIRAGVYIASGQPSFTGDNTWNDSNYGAGSIGVFNFGHRSLPFGTLLIAESYIQGVFGAPMFLRGTAERVSFPFERALATAHGNVLYLAVLLKPHADNYSDPETLGLMALRFESGEAHVQWATQIPYSALPHPLFRPHQALKTGEISDWGLPAGGEPVDGGGMTSPKFARMTIATDGEVLRFSSLLFHTVPAKALSNKLPPPDPHDQWYWRLLSLSALFSLELNAETGAGSTEIRHVNSNAALKQMGHFFSLDTEETYGTLETAEAGAISNYISENDWLSPSWPVEVLLAYADGVINEYIAFANGSRSVEGDVRNVSEWASPAGQAYAIPRTTISINGRLVATNNTAHGHTALYEPDMVLNVFTGSLQTLRDTFYTYGKTLSCLGGGEFEVQMYTGSDDERAIPFRISGNSVTEVPGIPQSAIRATSTCYEPKVVDEQGNVLKEHRSIITYHDGSKGYVQARYGDSVIAEGEAEYIDSITGGAYYTGNPLAFRKERT